MIAAGPLAWVSRTPFLTRSDTLSAMRRATGSSGLVFVAALFSCALCVAADPAPDDRRSPAGPTVHKGDGWGIAGPGDWSVFPGGPPTTLLYLIGDGREGVPLFDGTLSVVKAGLQVQRFADDGSTIKARVDADLKELTGSRNFTPLKEPQVNMITLSDGTEAVLLRAEFIRRQNGRLSISQKVYCQGAAGRHIVATGFVTCGRPGAQFVRAIGLPEFVEAHVRSLVLDPGKVDETKLSAAYKALDWSASAAIRKTSQANDLLERHEHAAAIKGFREALGLCPQIPAAHNGLAWALLEREDATPRDLAEALREAKTAVEQTAELDYSALDTLAFAQERNGDKGAALAAVRKALKLEPDHPDLRRRLEAIERGE